MDDARAQGERSTARGDQAIGATAAMGGLNAPCSRRLMRQSSSKSWKHLGMMNNLTAVTRSLKNILSKEFGRYENGELIGDRSREVPILNRFRVKSRKACCDLKDAMRKDVGHVGAFDRDLTPRIHRIMFVV
jgi:hypothetical protein